VRRIPFLGEPVSAAVGVSNPWMLVGQLSLLLLVIFVADASVTVWRRGDRRSAAGGSIVFFVLARNRSDRAGVLGNRRGADSVFGFMIG